MATDPTLIDAARPPRQGIPLGAEVVLAAICGVAIAAALWWLYFDVVAIVAERNLTEKSGLAQIKMARNSYSYIHIVMIAASS